MNRKTNLIEVFLSFYATELLCQNIKFNNIIIFIKNLTNCWISYAFLETKTYYKRFNVLNHDFKKQCKIYKLNIVKIIYSEFLFLREVIVHKKHYLFISKWATPHFNELNQLFLIWNYYTVLDQQNKVGNLFQKAA